MNGKFFFGLIFFFILIPAYPQVRTWQNAEGVKIEAELFHADADHVLLGKGISTYRVPVDTLSQADQRFVREWIRERNPAAAREPAAAQSTGRGSRGEKKGIGLSTSSRENWRDILQALDVVWFYNWTASEPHDVPEGIEWVPMVFGREGRVPGAVNRIKREKEHRNFRYVLGHNEPDASRQADRTVEDVLEEWPLLMEIDLPLVSPGAVHPDREWMTSFMSGVDEQGLRVDFIAVHSYGGPDARAFLNRLDRIYRKYRRPIWITEFAVGDWDAETVEENRHSQREILAFMRRVLPELERRQYIYRYAWFPARPDNPALGTSALFDEDGELTPLGEFYSGRH